MMLKKIMLSFLFCSCLTGCYRMPTDDDYCLVPNLNNPDITRDKGNNSMMPNMGF
jgi:hypothetical protein